MTAGRVDRESAPREAGGRSRAAGAAGRSLAMGQRLLTAAVGIPVLFLAIKQGPVWVCFALVSVCAALAAREACRLLETPSRRPFRTIAMGGAVLMALPFLDPSVHLGLPLPRFGLGPALMTILAASLLASAFSGRGLKERLEACLGTLFATLFVGFPLGYLTGLRAVSDEEMGRDLLVLLLVVIWVGDTAAMSMGWLLGRRPLAPLLSPRKTVEGAAAGIAASVGSALIAHLWWFHRLAVPHAVVIGLLLGVAGIAGDLAESLVKRAAGAKDSAAILPGHGGLLDRIDSLLFAGPALYYYYLALLR